VLRSGRSSVARNPGVRPEVIIAHGPTIVVAGAGGFIGGQVKIVLGWEPTTGLRNGLAATYGWIRDQIVARVTFAAR
jgi:hypothetical protein